MAHAEAAQAQEYVLILLDQTGSMCADQVPCPANSPWQNSIKDAKNWVQSVFDNSTSNGSFFFSIWTFKNT